MYRINRAELQSLLAGIQIGPLRDSLGIVPDEDVYLQSLMDGYLLLTHCPELITDHFPTISKNDLLYNRYYWFVKYKNEYCAGLGYDAGLEQQVFQLLEELEQELVGQIDWAVIKEIDEELGVREQGSV